MCVCPGKSEAAYFISPKVAQEARIAPVAAAPTSPDASDPFAEAENKIELRRLVQQAVQLREQARLDEAVAALRQAMKLDPENCRSAPRVGHHVPCWPKNGSAPGWK